MSLGEAEAGPCNTTLIRMDETLPAVNPPVGLYFYTGIVVTQTHNVRPECNRPGGVARGPSGELPAPPPGRSRGPETVFPRFTGRIGCHGSTYNFRSIAGRITPSQTSGIRPGAFPDLLKASPCPGRPSSMPSSGNSCLVSANPFRSPPVRASSSPPIPNRSD